MDRSHETPPHITTTIRAERALRYATLVFAIGLVAHTIDHLRRGVDVLTLEVIWAGCVSTALAVTAIGLALAGYSLAPMIAVVYGFSQALGVVAVHILPRWSRFSDSLPDGNVDAVTWAAVLIEMLGALAFGGAGAYMLYARARRRVASAARIRTVN